MGQKTVSNSKFAGEGSISREEAFNRLLQRGVGPEKILELAKQTPSELGGGGFAKAAPAGIAPVLKETGWEYGGKNSMGIHEFKEPGTNISISVRDADLNPAALRARIASKLKDFGRLQ